MTSSPLPPNPLPHQSQGASRGRSHWVCGIGVMGAASLGQAIGRGQGIPRRKHTPWSVSQDLASFSHFPTICRPVGLQWGLEVIPGGGGVRVALASQCSFQTSCEISGFWGHDSPLLRCSWLPLTSQLFLPQVHCSCGHGLHSLVLPQAPALFLSDSSIFWKPSAWAASFLCSGCFLIFFSLFSLATRLPLLTVAMVPASSCPSSWSVQEPNGLGVTLSWIWDPSLLLTVCVMVGKWLKLCKPLFPPLWHGYNKEGSLKILL